MVPLVQPVLPVEPMEVVIRESRGTEPVPAILDGLVHRAIHVPPVIMVQAVLFVRPVYTGVVIKVWRAMELVPAPLGGMGHSVILV
jgi:hypothetical protein